MSPQRRLPKDLSKPVVLAALLAALAVALYLLRPAPELPDGRVLSHTSYDDLEGWDDDDQRPALIALLRSCARWQSAPDERVLLANSGMGTIGDWRPACRQGSETLSGEGDSAAREFFEQSFQPFAVLNNDQAEGLFTAYFQIEVTGSTRAQGPLSVPLYARPTDLVQVNLGHFRAEFEGRNIAGRVENGRLIPFAPRADIDQGALAGKSLEIVWVDNPVDAFFLHIQGSGRVMLPDGSIVRVGYDGTNGHPYTTVGGLMIERGLLPPGGASMESIRDWIAAHPEAGAALMAENARYVFFRVMEGDAPLGAQSVPLTDGRSLAVDRKYLPLGVPLWVETITPSAAEPEHFRRLMIAQDTGGAITGPVRGDIYWGTGPEAGAIAGRMKYPGRYYVLLPNAVAQRLRDAE